MAGTVNILGSRFSSRKIVSSNSKLEDAGKEGALDDGVVNRAIVNLSERVFACVYEDCVPAECCTHRKRSQMIVGRQSSIAGTTTDEVLDLNTRVQ